MLLAALLAACGGGGGPPAAPPVSQPPAAPPASQPPAPAPPPVAQVANRAPVVAQPNVRVRTIVGREFRYDASRGGTTFVDPDGDPLTYTVSVAGWGVALTGPTIVHTPTLSSSVTWAAIRASDGRGGEAVDGFDVYVDPNSLPTVATPNGVLVTTLGAHVNRDLTQSGSTFSDADGDALSYSVRLLSQSGAGISLAGTSVVGALTSPIAGFAITATDRDGGSATDTFVVAAPAPPPGPPALPAQGYVYDDDELPLPLAFDESRRFLSPFWDTAATQGNPPTNAGATLGRVLFYDRRLSVSNTHACASCHVQARGFTTGDRFPRGVLGTPVKRNALALANSRYNFPERYFIDHRELSLERLALLPIADATELGNTLPLALAKVASESFYPPLFEAAFGTPEVTAERMATALAQFLRSIVSYRSRFDEAYMKLDEATPPPDPAQVLTPLELDGVTLFEGLGCPACHRTHAHTLDFPTNNGLDAVRTDPGIDGDFRAASLRNVAVSGPYMHDGRFATLREVIDHYDAGVQDSPDLDGSLRENFEGPPRRLGLTEHDKAALEAFLHVLTDEALLTDPKFADPFQ